MSGEPGSAPVPFALVQHAHQKLVTDGYPDREGVSELYAAMSGLLARHLATGVPLSLHLSGLLTEAFAWHAPEFAELVHRLRERGLVELVGSTYAQNVMPVSSPEHNRRQLEEGLHLMSRHYGVAPEEVRCLWVPERVWHEKLLEEVTDERLPNGGYSVVLLDDRLAYLTCNGGRQSFDCRSAPALGSAALDPRPLPFADERHVRPFHLDGPGGLVVVPISSELRYCLPPLSERHWAHLRRVVECVARAGEGALACFGDDLERSAGVGPWGGRWEPARLAPYTDLLRWLAEDPGVRPVTLSAWLAEGGPWLRRPVEPGTYFELAAAFGAGEDYAGWWWDHHWTPYREVLGDVEGQLGRAGDDGGDGLVSLAWKQLMAASTESGWHEHDPDGGWHPAPWVRSAAAHAREARLVLAAASPLPSGPLATVGDLDTDGTDEVVLATDEAFAVISPRFGGRLVLLCDRRPSGGVSLIGNPIDDWNWQEQPHRFMDAPRNHPGAFADVGAEHDRYQVEAVERAPEGVGVVLVNIEEGSLLAGVRKTYRLAAGRAVLEVTYQLPPSASMVSTDLALSPDYLHLLREGRRALVTERSRDTLTVRAGRGELAVVLPGGEPVAWDRPAQVECGHALVARVTAWGSFRIQLGLGVRAASATPLVELPS